MPGGLLAPRGDIQCDVGVVPLAGVMGSCGVGGRVEENVVRSCIIALPAALSALPLCRRSLTVVFQTQYKTASAFISLGRIICLCTILTYRNSTIRETKINLNLNITKALFIWFHKNDSMTNIILLLKLPSFETIIHNPFLLAHKQRGTFNDGFIANILESVPVKEFLKLVNI